MDKPFLSYDQQIEKLKNDYGLTISNYDFALESIKSLSYYDLVNGYQSIYIRDGKYDSSTTIELLVATHLYNKNIQGVLIKYSMYVENSFKNILANVIAENLSADHNIYLNIDRYHRHRNPSQRRKLDSLIRKLKNRCIRCSDTPTSHYIESKDHVPPWILLRNTYFSDSTDLFSFLPFIYKKQVINNFSILCESGFGDGLRYEIFLDAAKTVRKFRNKIAHNLEFLSYRDSRLNKNANKVFENTLSLPNESNLTRHDVWGMVISIVILLNNNYLSHNFLSELESFLDVDPAIVDFYCEKSGIPNNYNDRISKYISSLNLNL